MGDVVGRLFREFAITLAVAILISAAVSLSFTPMLCAASSRRSPREPPRERRRTRATRCSIASSNATEACSGGSWPTSARGSRSRRPRWSAPWCSAWRHPEGLLSRSRHGVRPGQSGGAAVDLVRGDVRAAASPVTSQFCDPAVESLSSIVGVDGVNTTLNSGRLLINLKPYPARTEERHGGNPSPRRSGPGNRQASPCTSSPFRT